MIDGNRGTECEEMQSCYDHGITQELMLPVSTLATVAQHLHADTLASLQCVLSVFFPAVNLNLH